MDNEYRFREICICITGCDAKSYTANQPASTYSKLTIETLQHGVKYVQS